MKRLMIVVLLLLIALMPAAAALAAPPFDKVVDAGETINNDVSVFNENLAVKEGSRINGDVAVFNGNVIVAGRIDGDLVLFNGDLTVQESAVLRGECVVLNGSIHREAGAGMHCKNFSFATAAGLANLMTSMPAMSMSVPDRIFVSHEGRFWWRLAEAAGRSLVLGLLAFVVASLLPQHVSRIEQTMRSKPAASVTVGVLTAVAVPALAALLAIFSALLLLICVGILGFPVVLAMLLALVAGALMGWVSVGNLVGQRLAEVLNLRNRSLPVTAAFGTMVITFVLGALGAIPAMFGAGLISFLVMSIGLGATALTRFGMQPFPPERAPLPKQDKVTAVLETLPPEDSDDFRR